MATPAEIAVTAAENLGILGEGETLPSYELDDLSDAYKELHAELEADGLATWGDNTATVPARFAWSVGIKTAMLRIVKYKIPAERAGEIGVFDQLADQKLRRYQAKGKLGQTQIENY